ncbi:Uncharacterised protein [Vibrio cholerae]|nr:Uncharacterised protein [Vibrio cholerae]
MTRSRFGNINRLLSQAEDVRHICAIRTIRSQHALNTL